MQQEKRKVVRFTIFCWINVTWPIHNSLAVCSTAFHVTSIITKDQQVVLLLQVFCLGGRDSLILLGKLKERHIFEVNMTSIFIGVKCIEIWPVRVPGTDNVTIK